MGLSGNVTVDITGKHTATLDLGSPEFPFSLAKTWTFTTGAGPNQVNELWSDERTLTTGATEPLGLSGTALKNFVGSGIAFARVKGWGMIADSTNTTNLTVGSGATPFLGPLGSAAHTLTLKPGDFFCFGSPGSAGWIVSSGSADNLQVTNASGASAKYKIVLIGTLT